MPRCAALLFALVCATALNNPATAGAPPPTSGPAAALASGERDVRAADQAFWAAFNACDAGAMAAYFTPDAEFYHDKTGLTVTRAGVVASLVKGPCADPRQLRLRRQAVAGTLAWHPLAGGYAMLTGQHRFLVSYGGKPEQHDSVAGYVEAWAKTAAGWQMRRVLSYDHRSDAPQLTPHPIAAARLKRFAGTYRSTDGGVITVERTGDHLVVRSGRAAFALVPLGEGSFGTEGRWLCFNFSGEQIVIVEEGQVVASGRKIS